MSTRSTILLTKDFGEHWYYETSEYSPKGNSDIMIHIVPENLECVEFDRKYEESPILKVLTKGDRELTKLLPAKEFFIPLKDVHQLDYDFDGLGLQICGDSIFIKDFISKIKQ